MRAFVLIRQQPLYRRESFVSGLKALNYEIHGEPREAFRPGDAVVIWNRYGRMDVLAQRAERAGAKVIVAENGYLGRDWRDRHWYALSRNFHNGGGWWPAEHPHTPRSQQRWTSIGEELRDWRRTGDEIVVLATRGIGPQGIREPDGWSTRIAGVIRSRTQRPVRIRKHPGEQPCVPLERDLAGAHAVVTWGSGGALKALLWGIPVFYGFPKWIGASAGMRITDDTDFDRPAMPPRQPMFQQLAWAMWSTEEIEKGTPFRCLLN